LSNAAVKAAGIIVPYTACQSDQFNQRRRKLAEISSTFFGFQAAVDLFKLGCTKQVSGGSSLETDIKPK